MVANVPTQGPTPTFPVATPATGAIYNGTTLLVPQFAVINATSTGLVIAAVPGQIIRVIAMDLVASNAMTIQWQTGSGGIISGPQSFAQNGGIVRPFNQAGWFQTLPGEELDINLVTGSGTVGGNITYVTL